MARFRFHLFALFCLVGQLAFSGLVARGGTATAVAGQRVTLTVTASGTAPFTHQWFKNGVALAGATAATHVIAGFKATDAGDYSARVVNYLGSTMSDLGTLVFTAAPLFTMQR